MAVAQIIDDSGKIMREYIPDTELDSIQVLVASNDAPQAVKDSADYVCNGTDDQFTIQSAINASKTGDIVRLTEGTFTINEVADSKAIELKSGIGFHGASRNETILQVDDSTETHLQTLVADGLTNITIRDLQIDNQWTDRNEPPLDRNLVMMNCSDVVIENVHLANADVGATFEGNSFILTNNILCSDSLWGIRIEGSHAVYENFACTRCDNGLDLRGEDITLRNCVFEDCNLSAGNSALRLAGASQNIIENISIRALTEGSPTVVGIDFVDDGSNYSEYNKLQQVYLENCTTGMNFNQLNQLNYINDSTFVSNKKDIVTVTPNSFYNLNIRKQIDQSYENAIDVTSATIILKNSSIDMATSTSGNIGDHCVHIHGDGNGLRNVIMNNQFRSSKQSGVLVDFTDQGQPDQNFPLLQIGSNNFFGCQNYGVELKFTANALVSGNLALANTSGAINDLSSGSNNSYNVVANNFANQP